MYTNNGWGEETLQPAKLSASHEGVSSDAVSMNPHPLIEGKKCAGLQNPPLSI